MSRVSLVPIAETETTPIRWLETQLPRRFDEYASDPSDGAWHHRVDLLRDGAALIGRWHRRLVDDEHVAPAAAATFLAGWIGGTLAGAIGHALTSAGAGFLVDDDVRWHVHPDGWIDRVELGRPVAVVSAEHPWVGRPGVEVLDEDEILTRTVESLVTLLRPIIDACHRLAPTGRVGLWNEVADGLGLAAAHVDGLPVRDEAVDVLARAVRVPGVPWRATPSLWIVDSAAGTTYVGQKGGCCLEYTCTVETEPDLDDDRRAFFERFPAEPGEPHYCTTCKFRDRLDSERRQLFWIERRRKR